MADTHDVLVDAAEQLVREEGLGALSMRVLASRTNYGKSTVHEALGGVDKLLAELRVRASRAMIAAGIGDTVPEPQNPQWREGMFRRISEWILAEPHWAEVCFQTEDMQGDWAHPVTGVLLGALPKGVVELNDEDGQSLYRQAVRTVGAVVPLVIEIDDVEFGSQALRHAFESIQANVAHLVEMRGLDTSPMPFVTSYN